MSLTLSLQNYTTNNTLEDAKAGLDAVENQPVLTLDNSQNFTANDYVLVGDAGGRVSAIYQVLSVTGNVVTLTANLKFFVRRGTPVTKLFGNKLKIYTAPYVVGAIPATANFTAISGGIIDIDPDQIATVYTHDNGSDQLWYKYTFYNSTTTLETSLSDATAVRDMRTSNYADLDTIRREAGFKDMPRITDDDIERKRQAAQAEINGALSGKYAIPFTQPIDPFIADITVRLAAGLLMCEQFGSFDNNGKTLGAQKRDDARTDLKKLQDGSSVLTDVAGVETVTADGGGFSSGFSSASPAFFTKSMAGPNSPDRF